MIYQSLTFWTLVAGLAAFVARFYFPEFPLDEVSILAAILFVLGLIGVVPTFRAQRLAAFPPIFNSLAFWQLVAGLAAFVFHFFAPEFPLDEVAIMAVILFVLSYFGITPELRLRGLL